MKKFFLTIFVLVIFSSLNFSFWYGNRGDCMYYNTQTACDQSTATTASVMNEGNKVSFFLSKASNYYLESYDHFIGFLRNTEMEGLVITSENTEMLDNALISLKQSTSNYNGLLLEVSKISYNQHYVDKLIQFDYTTFQKKNGFNPLVFQKLQSLLQAGDVDGIWAIMRDETLIIHDELLLLKSDVAQHNESQVRTLMSRYTDLLNFGQYAAACFYDITKADE